MHAGVVCGVQLQQNCFVNEGQKVPSLHTFIHSLFSTFPFFYFFCCRWCSTAGKKYRRRIVVITDAEHEVDVDGEQLQCVVDGLKSLEVQLIVIGIGFQQMPSAPPDNGALGNGDDSEEDLRPDAVVSGMHADCDGNRVMIKEEGNPDDMADEGVKREAITGELVKQENEKLLRR